MARTETCFLCAPDDDLVYHRNGNGFALCGLGPLVKGYSVIATAKHIRSAADAAAGESPDFLDFASAVRAKLTAYWGNCLVTEHGRLPVCVDVSGTSEAHCYHAHFLFFPGAPLIDNVARTHFACVEEACSLREALDIARSHSEYFLLSPKPDSYLVMSRPGRIARQFSRLLVAKALGRPELASWRKHPMRDTALATTAELRPLF